MGFHQHHGLRLHLFEPSRTFFRSLQESLGGYPGLTLHNYGLGAHTRWTRLHLSGTASRTLDEFAEPLANGSLSDTLDGDEERVLVRAVAEAVPEIFAGGHDRQDSG